MHISGYLSALLIIKCAQCISKKVRYFDVDKFMSIGMFILIILPIKVPFVFTNQGDSHLELQLSIQLTQCVLRPSIYLLTYFDV